MLNVRAAAVAGLFYPRETSELSRAIQALFAEATGASPWLGVPKALIVPHAGYIYSGPIAASAFALLKRMRARISRVVLLGPAHRVPLSGLALPGASAFETPLGRIPVDGAAAGLVSSMPQVCISPTAHAHEHSIEVQLPFLQQTLEGFQLVPVAVGHAEPEEVAEVLEALWGGPETLIVVSSDLSHDLPYNLAQQLDRQTCTRITELDLLADQEQACGAAAVNGLILEARRHHLTPHLMDLRNSGDTAGDRIRVVGYASFAFIQAPGRDH